MSRPTAFSALAFLCALLLGCESAENPLAPSGTVLTITAVPSQIPLSGEGSRVTVIGVKPDGNPINPGTQITFIASLGVLRPAAGTCGDDAVVDVVEADDRGRASALLCGDGRSGEAMVTATLTSAGGGGGTGEGGGGATGASASVTVQVGQTETSRPTLVISANPSIVPVGGQSLITLIGRNSDGTPVASGSRIRLTADLGTLTCGSGSQCPGESSDPCNAVCTSANGDAEATFTAGDRSGAGQVTAILGTAEAMMVSIDINAALENLDLVADPNVIDRLEAGMPITLTATLTDPLGTPLSSVLVRFSSQAGSLSASTDNSDSQGVAEVTLTVATSDVDEIPSNGTFRVTASATSEGEMRTATVDIRVR